MPDIKTIGIYTSGGDCPGMNAAIRACVRIGISKGLKMKGFIGGYHGLLNRDVCELQLKSVANIIQRGGTFLKTGRCPEFLNASHRLRAQESIKKENVDALICIGGDGSFMGAETLYNDFQIPIVGIPATIDNDIYKVDKSIGYDTAVNTALDAIDKIRDTAASHDRLFIVEVMGRNSGFIATAVGIAGGAEEVFTAEAPANIDQVIKHIKNSMNRGKQSSILISAEGQKPGRAYDLAEQLRLKAGLEARVCILGHIQRGGSPLASDRILASRYAEEAISMLLNGISGKYVAFNMGQFINVDLAESRLNKKHFPQEMIKLLRTLSI
ncbi:MAG: 6-phosphofructokinase [Bdellovibrionaceae bacterium]|mgnify:CR=1 FL=1|jgi:6-phosphofructokinase 1|nr:6-phosphofructokinase [Pseudobdellovibrionaceae bacterium]